MSDGKRDGDGTLPMLSAGWAFVGDSRKAHYFLEGGTICLCRKYGFYRGPREDSIHDASDNCAACRKARKVMFPT